MQTVTLARHAMATRFELVLHGDNPAALRAAGEEALDEIDRLENQLSLYRPGSEVAQLNARAARESVRVTPAVFALLQHARQLHAETGGAFDITIAPLVRCWGFMGRNHLRPFCHNEPTPNPSKEGSKHTNAPRRFPSWEGSGVGWSAQTKVPSPEAIAEARGKVGMQHVQLDEPNRTVRFAREGVMLDLGAIGKGYAVGQAAEILRGAGIVSALIHGGTSTVYAIGNPPDGEFWKMAIETPPAKVWSSALTRSGIAEPPEGGTPNDLPAVSLRDEAMSVSAMWGRSFQSDGTTFGHVIDPRTGQPVSRSLLAVVALPSATETDALSTALLTLGEAGHEAIARLRPGMRTLLVAHTENGLHAEVRGFEVPAARERFKVSIKCLQH